MTCRALEDVQISAEMLLTYKDGPDLYRPTTDMNRIIGKTDDKLSLVAKHACMYIPWSQIHLQHFICLINRGLINQHQVMATRSISERDYKHIQNNLKGI